MPAPSARRFETLLLTGVVLSLGCTGSLTSEAPGGPKGGSAVADLWAGPSAPPSCTVYPAARLRRLTNAEYDASVAMLLGTKLRPAAAFPTEFRQSNFSRNEAQTVDPVYALAAQQAAESLASEAVAGRLATLAPCASGEAEADCAARFIETFGARAFRRPLTEVDRSGLAAIYAVGAEGTDTPPGSSGCCAPCSSPRASST